MPPKDKYTDPELRDQVKEEIQNSDKGGAPGQWSARKAQFMAQEYKKRGGGYTTDQDQKDESQKNLDNWTEEEWQTKEGSGHAKQSDGSEKRYLPKKAWEKMTDEEKEETDQKKQAESKEGKQFVENTDKAKQSRKKASKSEGDDEQEAGVEDEGDDQDDSDMKSNGATNNAQKGQKQNAQNGQTRNKAQRNGQQNQDQDPDDEEGEEGEEDDDNDDDVTKEDDGEDEYVDDRQADVDKDGDEELADEIGAPQGNGAGEDEDKDEDEDAEDDNQDKSQVGQKRKANDNKQSNGTSKKQKGNSGDGKPAGTVGSKHMDATEPAPRGSKAKLPKKGQRASWKAMPGYVDGEVVDVLTADQEVDGKSQKASKGNPKVVLKSDKSGKIAVHKPDSCFYYI